MVSTFKTSSEGPVNVVFWQKYLKDNVKQNIVKKIDEYSKKINSTQLNQGQDSIEGCQYPCYLIDQVSAIPDFKSSKLIWNSKNCTHEDSRFLTKCCNPKTSSKYRWNTTTVWALWSELLWLQVNTDEIPQRSELHGPVMWFSSPLHSPSNQAAQTELHCT